MFGRPGQRCGAVRLRYVHINVLVQQRTDGSMFPCLTASTRAGSVPAAAKLAIGSTKTTKLDPSKRLIIIRRTLTLKIKSRNTLVDNSCIRTQNAADFRVKRGQCDLSTLRYLSLL